MKYIAFITDIHLNEQFPADIGIDAQKNWERIIEELAGKGIQNIVFGGDIGDPLAHPWFFESLRPFAVNIVLGNHDRYQHVSKHYQKGEDANELFYTLEEDRFKFIFLDTSLDRLSAIQLQWLKSELVTPKKVIIFMHHPVIAVDTPVDRLYPLENRAEVLSLLLATAKPITLFCGHYHMNHESTFENITQIITQSASYQIVREAPDVEVDATRFGYRLIDLSSDEILTQCYALDYKQAFSNN